MRILSAAVGVLVAACGGGRDSYPDATNGDAQSCVGLECQVVNCTKQGKPPTSLTGTVFAPNGTLALYGATVYVPNIDPGPFTDGVSCARCEDQLPGEPIVQVVS